MANRYTGTQTEKNLQEALRLSLEYYGENDACEVIRRNLEAVQQRKS